MLETNIRIVHPGSNLYVLTRRGWVRGSHLSPDLLQKACGRLRYQFGLAAIPFSGDPPALLVATSKQIQTIHLEDEDWELEVVDAGEPTQRLKLESRTGQKFIPSLIERALLGTLAKKTDFWTLDSPRIWYEERPFFVKEGIAAYRRFEVAAFPISGIGVGVAVDVSTAFFTVDTLDYFFNPDIGHQEQAKREELFAKLTNRQQGQKGTLLYDTGRSRVKCYFESAPVGITCSTTGKIRVKGLSYSSLLAYYGEKYPILDIEDDAPAVRVSFKGIGRPVWVAARLLRVRVMNEIVPRSLSSIDKISPNDRRSLIQDFWARLGQQPFGQVAPGLHEGFWRPVANHTRRFSLCNLTYGQEECLIAPTEFSVNMYRKNYRQRLKYLNDSGCYSVSPAMTRTLHYAYPESINKEIATRLANDLTSVIQIWTRCHAEAHIVSYESLAEGIEKLNRTGRVGLAVFVLNEEPAAYHEVSFQLDRWRIKRITDRTLVAYYKYLTEGVWDRKTKSHNLGLGESRWRDFITENALDVLQLLDAIPYRLDQQGLYEAQIVIDVGHDQRFFALSLLIARSEKKSPSFSIVSDVHIKPDHQHQAINPVILADQILKLFEKVPRTFADPLDSLLVIRDGQFCGQEIEGVDSALAELKKLGRLTSEARVDLVDLHKDTLKAIRMWEIDDREIAENPLEGTAIKLDACSAVVASTGAATLTQGTAHPFMLVGNDRCREITDAALAAFAGAQLNWSSPRVAQRLTLPLKRTDEELKARSAQEIRRLL